MEASDDVAGKRIVITGGTEGIGLAGARALHEAGANLTLVARNPDKARAIVAALAARGRGRLPTDIVTADLSLQSEVRRASAEIASRYPHIDILINNAGAMFTRRIVTADGIEMTWALNHLAPFLMTSLLLDRLRAAPAARIITTASDAHWRGGEIPFEDINAEHRYRGFPRYGQTKLANILFTRELARQLAGTRVTANCYHPGLVATQFNGNNGALMNLGMVAVRLIARTPEKGAETMIWLARSSEAAGTTGAYFFDMHIGRSSAVAKDDDSARRLWALSERQVAGSA